MKLNKCVLKLIFYCIAAYIAIYFYMYLNGVRKTERLILGQKIKKIFESDLSGKKSWKSILLWTSKSNIPFSYMGNGEQGFVKRNCLYTNCFVTSDRSYLGNYTNFDVIAFSGPDLAMYDYITLPTERSQHQIYVFASIESAQYYPLCKTHFNDFFNWTWTYRLDSDVRWGYIVVRDLKGNIIGPNKNMDWLKVEEMKPVKEEFKKSLQSKSVAAAWFVSNCGTFSGREEFVLELQKELIKYNHVIDIYGKCGLLSCPRDNERCDSIIKEKYYFYLAFENSLDEDYVTEKLLHALRNDAVPIVYGGANYTRFMPKGIYLDVLELGIKKLAAKMIQLINNPEEYAQYFKWKNHYTFHKTSDSIETNEYCRFCEVLNDENYLNETSVYRNFVQWWNHDQCNLS